MSMQYSFLALSATSTNTSAFFKKNRLNYSSKSYLANNKNENDNFDDSDVKDGGAASSTTGSIINILLLLSDVITFSYSLPEVFGFAAQNDSVELTCSSADRAFSIFELPCKDVDDPKIMCSLFIDEVISRPEELCISANKKFETRKYETLKMEMIKILV
uniref:Uncharacterized protein n=1 Tax=Glossina palpalis gambiensis TaxID=67801 RepID=A0A1B0BFW7_9MUSC